MKGVGKISTMDGEISDPSFTCSLPLYLDNNNDDVTRDINLNSNDHYHDFQRSIDLATLFQSFQMQKGKSYWKGRIPGSVVLDKRYPAIGASFVSLPFSSQIVIDGYICSNEFLDKDRACVYGNSNSNSNRVNDSSSSSSSSDSDRSSEHTSEDVNDEKIECPVCKFMKAGPCKEECESWDRCIQNINSEKDLADCFTVTNEMIQCMIKYEYYDILTANMPVNDQKR